MRTNCLYYGKCFNVFIRLQPTSRGITWKVNNARTATTTREQVCLILEEHHHRERLHHQGTQRRTVFASLTSFIIPVATTVLSARLGHSRVLSDNCNMYPTFWLTSKQWFNKSVNLRGGREGWGEGGINPFLPDHEMLLFSPLGGQVSLQFSHVLYTSSTVWIGFV